VDGISGAYNITPGYGGPRFSKREIREIIISVLMLALAFTLAMMSGQWSMGIYAFLTMYVICLILVTMSFIPHELGHKFLAQRYGAWSEYRMSIPGLLIAVAISFSGFLFAAPGVVWINGRINNVQNGKISAAGPAVNLTIGAVGIALWLLTGNIILFMIAYLNAILALFNLIPFPPLDGSKIIKWNTGVWGAMLAAGVLEVLIVMGVFF
jgi:Zn-dependent protease